ncbi:MAG: trypsin-like peptidase domain-containing protein [Candidatus Caenarcaniphilales bacterium]|nr:trypsin-like peptidase domain-containing protein [Candidatus Caenarcaniphilales bacterium]
MFQRLLLIALIAIFTLPFSGKAQMGAMPLGTDSVANIAEKAAPSVVSLEVSVKGKRTIPSVADVFDLGNARIIKIKPKVLNTESKVADGSGFIISKDGYIITNYHVVNPPSPSNPKVNVKASKIEVVLYDGKRHIAKLIGEDKDSDLAVIQIDAKNLKPIEWGNSAKVRPGDFAVTIGSSLGADHTVGFGVISAVSRKKPEIGLAEALVGDLDYIQTYAQINPGNSGGPLINMKGEVVGIANFIERAPHSPGFAIPSNYAKVVTTTLIQDGRIRRPSIGAHLYPFQEKNGQIETDGSSKKILGAIILDTLPGGPSDKLGLKQKDLITKFNGKKIATIDDFIEMIHMTRSKPVGTVFDIEVLRGNQVLNQKIKTEFLDVGDDADD